MTVVDDNSAGGARPRKVRAKVRKILVTEVEVDAPDHIGDEIDWYGAVESSVYNRIELGVSWETEDETVDIVDGYFIPHPT